MLSDDDLECLEEDEEDGDRIYLRLCLQDVKEALERACEQADELNDIDSSHSLWNMYDEIHAMIEMERPFEIS